MHRLSLIPFTLTTLALLTGCGATSSQLASPIATGGHTLHGKVHGGQQPVVGAHIYLLSANPGGYGAPSASLINPTLPGVSNDGTGNYILTDSAGSFSLSGDYTCTPGHQIYILATGGNPGLAAGTTNPALAMMSALGACPSEANFANEVPYIYINEVTTVASVYALAGFMSDASHISSAGTSAALQGIGYAFAAINTLVDISSGTALTQNLQGNAVIPQSEINTLANILVPCINSTGTSTACSTLFANTKNSSGTVPIDTVTAALNIAHNPGANVATLFGLVPSTPPFQPNLTAAPNDWTVAITFYAENMAGPYFPAIDSAGNIWVPAYSSNTLNEFDPLGNVLSAASGFTGGGLNLPYSVAIDSSGNAWVVNFAPIGASTVSKFLPNGNPATSTPYACSAACFFIAIDTAQNLWISGTTRTTVLKSSGASLAQFSTSAYNSGIAIDSTGKAWTVGQIHTLDSLTLPTAVAAHLESVTSSTANELTPLAIDSADNIWFSSNKNNTIGKVSSAGTVLSPSSGYTGGGLNGPAQIAIDGANQVWVANRDGNSISAFTNTGAAITPSTGYQATGINGPRGLAIDRSGNVWITNFNYNSITEFLGIAAPTSTPITPANHGQLP